VQLDAANGRADQMSDKIDELFVSNEEAKELARAMAREAMEKMKAEVSQAVGGGRESKRVRARARERGRGRREFGVARVLGRARGGESGTAGGEGTGALSSLSPVL
jgi:hypothetical protein